MTAAEHSKLIYLFDAIEGCKNAPDKIKQLIVIATPASDEITDYTDYLDRLTIAYCKGCWENDVMEPMKGAAMCVQEARKIREEIR